MQPHSRRETFKGILLLVASVSLFGVVDGLSKVLVETQSFGQIMLARYGLALPLLFVVSGFPSPAALFRTTKPGMQIMRGVAPLIIGGSMVFAVRYLPLAEATVILFAGPFIVVALSGPLLGERVGPASWIGVVLGFIAVFMVARPGFSDVSVYAIFPFVAALLGFVLFAVLMWKSYEYGQTLRITHEVTSASRIPIFPFVFWLGLCCLPLCLVLLKEMVDSVIEVTKK
jgi:drug/metabolite transporter (DMT)-like permease